MAAFLIRRFAQGVAVVGLAVTIVFFLIHVVPGDPFADSIDHSSISPAIRNQLRAAYGLDDSLPRQYVRYVANVARGDLGFSFSHQRPVRDVLADALPNTLALMGLALALSFAVGIAAALIQVRNRGSTSDHMISAVSFLLISVPDFLFALVVLTLVPFWFSWFPIGGAIDPLSHDTMGTLGKMLDRLRHLVLPAVTLALLYFPVIARHHRAAMLDVLPSDFVKMARAKGVAERAVIDRHVLRNALLPLIAIVGVAFPALLTGAVFVETVFSWPGMGLIIVRAIGGLDYMLVTATVLLGSAFVVTGSIIADTLYKAFDPRLRDGS